MSVTGAEALNEKWDALSARFDLLKSVPKDQARLINAAISQWQDWYWDKYEAWPSTELLAWQDRYVKAARLLDAVAAKTVVVSKPQQVDTYKPPKPVVQTLPPLLITAKPPTPPPKLADMGTVDVSGWSKLDLPTGLSTGNDNYNINPGTQGWEPSNLEVALNRSGLAAVLGAIGVAVFGKRSGWL